MRNLVILCTCLLVAVANYAQSTLKYSRVNVDLTSADPRDFVKAGFDLEHSLYLPNRMFIGDMSEIEIAQVASMGFSYKVLIDDMQAHYSSQTAHRSIPECREYDYDYAVPQNFVLGSMGGYLTYQEMIDMLDLMSILYPHLVSGRQQAGETLSHQGRRIEWVRISDNPENDEPEPEVLYTALHHAREPMSMMQMIYYMWYLLENYDSSPEIKYLVDNTELYFVPCVNPDGYIYNHNIAPDGGGNWRKNMRDNNGDGVFNEKDDGVDLNRNYAFEWGSDDEGSSSNPGSITFRGPEPFSEPEIQAVRDFVAQREFVCALNYHSFGNYILYPWGFSGDSNPDSLTFANYADHLTSKSGFGSGTTEDALGYLANGVASDWMYAMHEIIAVTPEIGAADWGFWPPQSEIIPLCNASLFKNLAIAHFTHRYAIADELNEEFITDLSGTLDIRVKRYGLTHGSLALSVTSLSPDFEILGTLQEVGLEMFDERVFPYEYSISPDAAHGDVFEYVVKLDNGFFEVRDTLRKTFGTVEIALDDKGSDIADWQPTAGTNWGITTEYAASGETSITDSPGGTYSPDAISEFTLVAPIDLHDAVGAELRFKARWEIEDIIDYAVVEASTDGINWTGLCGEYSSTGSIFQRTGEPVYDGYQYEWVNEFIDLEDFLGGDLYIRFGLYSDAFFELDGFYVDDIQVTVFGMDEGTSSTIDLDNAFTLNQYPNPTSGSVTIRYDVSASDHHLGEIRVYDMLGRQAASRLLPDTDGIININTSNFPEGMYVTSLFLDGVLVRSERLVVASR